MRVCVIDFGGSWDSYLPLAVFSYKNNYHSSIGTPPFEMLYGRKCRTLVCWGEVGHKVMGRIKVVLQTTEMIHQIRQGCIPLRAGKRVMLIDADLSWNFKRVTWFS